MTDIFEGSLIRCFRRLQELIRQMSMAAKAIGNNELEEKFNKAAEALERQSSVVFNVRSRLPPLAFSRDRGLMVFAGLSSLRCISRALLRRCLCSFVSFRRHCIHFLSRNFSVRG